MAKFNTAETIATMIETANDSDQAMRAHMTELAAEFGDTPMLPMKDGGINGNSFREGSTLETQQKDADRIGLPLAKAQSLAAIRAALNAHRPTLWQTYQISYFGLNTIKPPKIVPAKSEADLEIMNLLEHRRAMTHEKKQVVADLRIAKAELTLAKAQGNEAAESAAKSEVAILEANRDEYKSMLDEKKEAIEELRGDKKAAPLLDAVQALQERLEKSKVLEGYGPIGCMTLAEIIEALS